jgi:ABC-type sugar transport system ATPase subunit
MQRVALGRAMIRDPAVFLFDEPLSNLDAKMRLEMRAEIARLHKRLSATMIYVTHDQAEAMTLGDRIAVMEAGVMQQVGPPMDVYRKPANRFVAGFIGTPPMNFLEDTGIRPHDIVVEDGGPIEAEVDLVEPMGAETYVHCRVGEERILVVTQEPPAGDRIFLRFPEEKIHRFDRE